MKGFSRVLSGLWFLFLFPFVTSAQSTNDLPPPRPPRAEIPPSFWELHGWSVVLAGCLGLMLVGVAVWFLLRSKPAVVVPPEVLARRELEDLRERPEEGAVLSRVSQVLRRYVAVAFDLPPGELTTAEFCRVMVANERIGPELAAALGDFLRRCDERKFAPTAATTDIGAAGGALELVELGETRRRQFRQETAQGQPAPPA